MDLCPRQRRDDPGNLVGGFVQKDAVGDGKRGAGGGELREADEAYRHRDIHWLDLSLRDGEREGDEAAGTEADEDGVAVNFRDARVWVDGVEQRGADESEHSPGEEPRHVPRIVGNEGPVADDGDHKEHDQGQHADTGLQC